MLGHILDRLQAVNLHQLSFKARFISKGVVYVCRRRRSLRGVLLLTNPIVVDDLPTLIASIPDPDVAGYLSESFTCLQHGAFRASIVMTAAAVFDKLRRDIAELGQVNTPAKQIDKKMVSLANADESFEKILIDMMRASEFLTKEKHDWLENLRKRRNVCAHPNGVTVSELEARLFLTDAITNYLRQSVVSHRAILDTLLADLKTPGFLPGRSNERVDAVAGSFIKSLDVSCYPRMVADISRLVGSDEGYIRQNAGSFLLSLARIGGDEGRTALATQLIATTRLDPDGHDGWPFLVAIDVIGIDAGGLARLPRDKRLQLDLALARRVRKTNHFDPLEVRRTSRMLTRMNLDLSAEVLTDSFRDTVLASVDHFDVVFNSEEPGHGVPLRFLHAQLASTDREIVDSFIGLIITHDAFLASKLDDVEAMEMLCRLGVSQDDREGPLRLNTPNLTAKLEAFYGRDFEGACAAARGLGFHHGEFPLDAYAT